MFTCTHRHWPVIRWGCGWVGVGWSGVCTNNVHLHLHLQALTSDHVGLDLGWGAVPITFMTSWHPLVLIFRSSCIHLLQECHRPHHRWAQHIASHQVPWSIFLLLTSGHMRLFPFTPIWIPHTSVVFATAVMSSGNLMATSLRLVFWPWLKLVFWPFLRHLTRCKMQIKIAPSNRQNWKSSAPKQQN